MLAAFVQHRADDDFIARLADIRRALVQRLRPQPFIGQPMSAYNTQRRELVVQKRNLTRLTLFHVENQHIGMRACNGRTYLVIPRSQSY